MKLVEAGGSALEHPSATGVDPPSIFERMQADADDQLLPQLLSLL
jgi:hypothetical protein